jgi:esterase
VDFSEQRAGQPHAGEGNHRRHDPTLTRELMERSWLAWYPNAELDVLEGCGHYPMHETPLALAAALDNYLQQPLQP